MYNMARCTWIGIGVVFLGVMGWGELIGHLGGDAVLNSEPRNFVNFPVW